MEETINARQRTSQVKLLNGTVVQRYLYKQVCKNIMSKLALVNSKKYLYKRGKKFDITKIQIWEIMGLVGIFRKKKMTKSPLANNDEPVSSVWWGWWWEIAGASVLPLIAHTVPRLRPKGVPYRHHLYECHFFLSEFHKSQICLFALLFKHPFIHRSNFLSRLPRFIRVSSKSNGIHWIWRIVPVAYLRNKWPHHDITAIFRIFSLLANFSILSDTLILYVFFVLWPIWGEFGFCQ